MQNILELVHQVDNISTFITIIAIGFLTLSKVGWDLWKHFKKQTKTIIKRHQKQEEDVEIIEKDNNNDQQIAGLELISDTYISIINNLRREVDRLKSDVDELSSLRKENEGLQSAVADLRSECVVLEAEIEKYKARVKTLTRKISRLIAEDKKRKKSSRLPV